MAKQDLSSLIGKAKETKMTVPMQRVVTVKEKTKETPFNVYFPGDLLKKLKILSAERETSIKNLIVTAVQQQYFKD